jgi:hypothetical protein
MTTEERLSRLERQNRWLKRLGALVIAVGAVVVLGGQGRDEKPSILRVNRLALVDDQGRERAVLGMYSSGRDGAMFPGLELVDEKGRHPVTILGSAAPTLILRGADTVVNLMAGPDGYAVFNMERRTGGNTPKTVLMFNMTEGRPSGLMFDHERKVIWKAPGE